MSPPAADPGPPPAALAALAALQRGGVPAVLVDAQQRVARANDAFVRACGLADAAVLCGRPLLEGLGAQAAALLGSDAAGGVELALRAADGGVAGWRAVACELAPGWRLIDLQPSDDGQSAQRRVAALEERLALLEEFCNAGMFERDPATMIGRWDAQTYRIFGLPVPAQGTASPALSTTFALVEPDDLKLDDFLATLRIAGRHATRFRIHRPDGSAREIHSQWRVFHDENGRPARVIGVAVDDTEVFDLARRAERSAHRLEAAAEAARIGLWSAGSDASLPSWNRVMYDHFGLDPAQPALRLRDWLQRCVLADDREAVNRAVRHWIELGSGPIEAEFRVVRPADGSVRWLVMRGRVASGVTGSRFEGVMLDITEQRETLQRLRDTADRVEMASTAVGLGSWESAITQARSFWDPQMFRLRGVESAARWVERDEMARYLHPEDRDAVIGEQARRFDEGSTWRSEFRVRWPDGTVRWLASRSTLVVDAQGRVLRRIGLNWDITEARQGEQAMRDRELAMAESQAKSRFLSRVSHELRTPLNAVLGFTQLLRDPSSAADEATREQWLGLVEASGRELLNLIDDVLSLSTADAGDQRLDALPLPLIELVRATLPLVSPLAAERQVQLIEPGELPGVVRADAASLRQVLVQLLSNAIKFNRRGGRVWLSAQARDEGIVLQVCDDGRGIDPARFGELFQPFSRLGIDTAEVEGTGIGLAIVKARVEAMGGRVEVHGSPGQGATFSVWMPSAKVAEPDGGAAPAAAPAVAEPATADARRVLYVEDNPVNTMLVAELLRGRPGLELTCAETGTEGIAQALATQPHLVLLDMQLPDMSGLEVFRALQARVETAAIPCVALSANAMAADVAAALQAGFADYWTKPIDFQQFGAGLERMLYQRR